MRDQAGEDRLADPRRRLRRPAAAPSAAIAAGPSGQGARRRPALVGVAAPQRGRVGRAVRIGRAPAVLADERHVRASASGGAAAICGNGSTQSAPPAFTSSPGMPQTTAVSSASAIVRPPCCRRRVMASAPSSPMPVISTPMSWLGGRYAPSRCAPAGRCSDARDSRAAPARASRPDPRGRRETMRSASPRPI